MSGGQRIALFLPSLAGGGAERVFVQLANHFATEGFAVDMVLATATGPYLEELSSGVRLVDLKSRGVLHSLPRLMRYLRRERPISMLSGLNHANTVAIMARFGAFSGTRIVISVRSVPTMTGIQAPKSADRVLRAARIAYRFASAIIANSHGVATDMGSCLGIAREKIDVIYNPLDLDLIGRMSAEPVAHPYCADGAPPFIMSAGRLSPLKDFPTLLSAFAMLRRQRECRLVVLGEGEDREALERLCRELGIEQDVALPGFDSNPFAWMRRAAVFVSSSLSEGCPNALMQALAVGTPVVSTDAVGGSAEILEGGKWGRLVPVADPGALAEAICSTLDSADRPDVRIRAGDFALSKVAREYLRVMLPAGSGAVEMAGSRQTP